MNSIIYASCAFTIGLIWGMKEANPTFDIDEIVYVNRPDTLRMRAFHTECTYVQDLWKEGVINPIVSDGIDRNLP